MASNESERNQEKPQNEPPKSPLEPPKNFSWCVDGQLAGCGLPASKENLQYLADQGIGHLVSLATQGYDGIEDVDLNVVNLPFDNGNAPSQEQVDTFLSVIEASKSSGKGVCVHCMGGHGRTGTMLGCYFIKEKGMTSSEAIDHVRALRPGSIDSNQQEEFLKQLTSDK